MITSQYFLENLKEKCSEKDKLILRIMIEDFLFNKFEEMKKWNKEMALKIASIQIKTLREIKKWKTNK